MTRTGVAAKVVALIVEDEPLIRMAAADLAEDAGFESLQAKDADEAIALLGRRQDIRIIITDVDMPGSMDGLALARAVRDRWPPIKIIVMSGRHIIAETDLPPGSRFFSKPLEVNKVVAAMREMVY